MSNYSDFIHLDFIRSILEKPIRENGILSTGNNLNNYLTFEFFRN